MKYFLPVLSVSIFLFSFSFFYYFVVFIPSTENIIDETVQCLDLWERVKDKVIAEYEIGNLEVIYNPRLDTCIMANMKSGGADDVVSFQTFVYDFVHSKSLYSYIDMNDEGVDFTTKDTFDEMIQSVNSFGFNF